jgi:hypothetical protein
MNVFMYCAALLCGDCGEKAVENCANRSIVDNGDSDTYPQGPYPEGGGEADTPQHCDDCGKFLENSLTEDGQAYVRESYAWERDITNPSKSRNAIENTQRWANYYDYLGLAGQSYVVWLGLAGQAPFSVGAALSCTVHGDLESAQNEAGESAAAMHVGDVLELIDANPE